MYFDCWIDDLLRGGLETIFLQLPPSELILPTTPLSPPTERVLEMLARRTDVRVERIDDAHFQRKDAAARLSKFYKVKLVVDYCFIFTTSHVIRFPSSRISSPRWSWLICWMSLAKVHRDVLLQ